MAEAPTEGGVTGLPYEKLSSFPGSEGALSVVSTWFITIWISSPFDCPGRGGGGGGAGGLFRPSSFTTLSRSNISSGLDDRPSFFLLFWMIPSRILTEAGAASSSSNVIGHASSRFACVEACISSWIPFATIGVELGSSTETERTQAERTSSDDCCATDIRWVKFSSGEPLRVLLPSLDEPPCCKLVNCLSPSSRIDSARLRLSMFTARFTSFSITSQTESDTGESSSIKSRFCRMLNRFTPWGLLLTYEYR